MGLLSKRESSRQKAAARIRRGEGFVVRSAEGARWSFTDRPLPSEHRNDVQDPSPQTTIRERIGKILTKKAAPHPYPESSAESAASIDESERHIVEFIDTHPYLQRLHDPEVRRIAVHSIVDQVLDEHEVTTTEARNENNGYQATS